ncbi:MAG: carboxymuconolactone decarboxylase family protein [Anaerovoracaceae bacterium]|jgi:AhpD family alkylhydroperoxidase
MKLKDPKELLNSYLDGARNLNAAAPMQTKGFYSLLNACGSNGALSEKFKELIGVAIGSYNRCEYCIVYHVYQSFKLGATREEVLEAALTAAIYGGGPTLAYISTLVQDSIEAFAPEFGK